MARRYMRYRVLFGLGDGTLAVPISSLAITQVLEGATTSVAEIELADATLPDDGGTVSLKNGVAVRIDQLDAGSPNPDGYPMRRLFKGVVNWIKGESVPRRIPVVNDGPLAKLKRCVRTSNHTLSGGGNTDVDAKKDVLTHCDIPYSNADIAGWGYVLGAVKPVVWPKGTSAAEVIGELDRVFHTATVEVGDGRVAAFPYSKVPADYGSGRYAGADVQQTFVRGVANARWMANARDRGSTDEICNVQRVEGLRWRDAAGCDRLVWAEASATHPLLPGQTVACEPIVGDWIQTEAFAKALAIQSLREKNRTPNRLRIDGANEALVNPGDLIAAQDPVYGISLATATPFLVTSYRRQGDRSTLDGEGGAAGDYGTVASGIDVCCGTQQADGTCTDEGTNPGPIDFPDVGIPPDPGLDICAFGDAACEPPVATPPETPPSEEPFLACTEDAYLTCPPDFAGTCHDGATGSSSCSGTPPASVCKVPGWYRKTWVESATIPVSYDCLCTAHARLREQGGSGHAYRVTADGGVDAFTICKEAGDPTDPLVAHYRVSAIEDPADADAADDLTVSGDLCVSFGYRFCSPGEEIRVAAVAVLADGSEVSLLTHDMQLFAEPGESVTTGFGDAYTLDSSVFHVEPSTWTGGAPPHTSLGTSYRNNGGVGPGPGIGLGADRAATVCFEMSGTDPRAFWDTGAGGGYARHLGYLDTESPLPGEPTHVTEDPDHVSHRLSFRLLPGDGSVGCADTDCPGPIVWGVVAGHSTCTANPDYTPVE